MTESTFIRTRHELEHYIDLQEEEMKWFSEAHTDTLPFMTSRYYASLVDRNDPHDPIRAQIVPRIEECSGSDTGSGKAGESRDPQMEYRYSPLPGLVHRYRSRAALLVTDTCTSYCRHCFRRRLTGRERSHISEEQVDAVSRYLEKHLDVKELLLTGGDPLTLSDSALDSLISRIRERRSDLILRICTRAVVTYPMRVTDRLIGILKKHSTAPMYLMTQFNHPREITAESTRAVNRFVDNGFPAMNQSVLLRGVNDDAQVLSDLCNQLVAVRVKPYYLFNGDMVSGTGHLRLPLAEAIQLERELRGLLSGLAMPVVAIDLPDGGGKVPIGAPYYRGEQEVGRHLFVTVDGQEVFYTDPVL